MLSVGDKSATTSVTVIGAAIFAALQAAESMGKVPPGVTAQAVAIAKALSMIIAAFGLRRAVGANGAPGFFGPEETETEEEEA